MLCVNLICEQLRIIEGNYHFIPYLRRGVEFFIWRDIEFNLSGVIGNNMICEFIFKINFPGVWG